MKIIPLLLSAAILGSATLAEAAEATPQGHWARGDGRARVRIEPCGRDLCAINTWIKPGTPDEKVGDKLVMSVTSDDGAKWSGKAFDPQRNMTYRLSMQVSDKTMTTAGCVLGGLLCKRVSWSRLD